jgi:hypothetical protein
MSTLSIKVRTATAACAIAAAGTLIPTAVAHATPGAPLPEAGLGSSLGSVTVQSCQPGVPGSCALVPSVSPGGGFGPIVIGDPLVWFGSPGNPDYQPLFGITFPNFFGLNFEACAFGIGVRLGPYGTGFAGLSAGC